MAHVNGIGGSVKIGEDGMLFQGGTESVEQNCLGVMMNEKFVNRRFDLRMLCHVFQRSRMSDFVMCDDDNVVFRELDEWMKHNSDMVDKWSGEERLNMERHGVIPVIREECDGTFDGYASCEDGLDWDLEVERNQKMALCGASFAFGGVSEMRIEVEMGGGTIVFVVAEESELNDDDDEDVLMVD